MNTRMELWKEYREGIERNASLQKAVMESNEKLNILHSRLLKVYPEYGEKYSTKLSQFEAAVNKIEQSPSIPINGISTLLEEINKIDNTNDSSFSSINNIEFGSDELIETLKSISERKLKKVEYISTASNNVMFGKTNVVMLGEKMEEFRIAIDGPSGSGKSTVAKQIAKKYNLKYINTGLVYRAVALKLIEDKINIDDAIAVESSLNSIKVKLLRNEIVELNGIEVSDALRSDLVSQNASIIATYPAVRKYAVNIQKSESARSGVIMDGRDTTFKIMPNADFKFFLDTSPEVRAKRRLSQNEEFGYSTDYDKILKEIKTRDHRDRTRKVDPLHKTKDAYLINASDMTIEEVVEKIIQIIEK